MGQEQLTQLSDEELLEQKKKLKSNQMMSAVIIGVFIGVAIFSSVTNGLSFWTFFPLFFVYLLVNNDKKNKALKAELAKRGL